MGRPGTADWGVRRTPGELDSTAYIEIGPGRYSGKHWQAGFVFIGEAAFLMAEGLVRREFPGYDRFGINEIPAEVGTRIIEAWRAASTRLVGVSPDEACTALALPGRQ
ncbi:MAG: hypothetical protein FJ087_03105 [Deltaproteobacteria bacterium]|nr:hypothetical protein [Deltaproteobacteria bacterium]